jgi:hypothetical protein
MYGKLKPLYEEIRKISRSLTGRERRRRAGRKISLSFCGGPHNPAPVRHGWRWGKDPMDVQFAPWRMAYIKGEKPKGCVFCKEEARDDELCSGRGRPAS